jgi:signal transduction histidine kinase
MAKLFTLVPPRIQYDQFWVEIKRRNRWLIMLRYGAVIMLTSLIFGIYFLQSIFPSFYVYTLPHWIIAFSILSYNIIFHYLWQFIPEKKSERGFHSLHFALLQIVFDFIALMLFMYFTGGIESPLFAFFIFHVIIGSLFLTGSVINLIITVLLIFSITGALLELTKTIPHYEIHGLLLLPLYSNLNYLVIFFILFGITLYLSAYLANSIAINLYRRERLLTNAYQELEDAEKTKSQYVISIVHDLKTPIVAAITYLGMLLDGTLSPLKEDHIKPVERSKARLSGAINEINDILNITLLRLDSSKSTTLKVSLKALFEEIFKEQKVIFQAKNISFNLYSQIDDDMIDAEPKIFKLALSNLISNSCKYTEPNGKVEIKIYSEHNDLIVSVADNGIGIPSGDEDKIFQDFFRTSVSKKKSIEGSGLGLSLVKQIIEKYNGTIKVVSPSYLQEENRPGSQFILTFSKIIKPQINLKLS